MRWLGLAAPAALLIACGSSSQNANDVTTYQDLADQTQTAASSYASDMAGAAMTVAACAGRHARYDAEVRPWIEQMVAMGDELDGMMGMHGGSDDADLHCVAAAMLAELDAHAALACSWSNVALDQREAARHAAAMHGYVGHVDERCGELMNGLDGDGWHWGGMMPGCSLSGGGPQDGGMGSGMGSPDGGVPPDGSADPLAVGRAIFDWGIGPDGQPIARTGGMPGMTGCASCHGADGHGRQMMMFTTPDITYANLTDPAGMREPDGSRGPTYDDASIRRAVTTGIDADGQPLETWMPRWALDDTEWNGLLGYLQTLP